MLQMYFEPVLQMYFDQSYKSTLRQYYKWIICMQIPSTAPNTSKTPVHFLLEFLPRQKLDFSTPVAEFFKYIA